MENGRAIARTRWETAGLVIERQETTELQAQHERLDNEHASKRYEDSVQPSIFLSGVG